MSEYGRGFLITLFGVLVISPDTLLIRLIDANHWELIFWRSSLSGMMILLGVFVLTGDGPVRQIRSIGRPGLLVAMSFAAVNLFFMYSVTHTLAANTLFIMSTSPVFSAIASRIFLKETVSIRTAITITASLIGIGLIANASLAGGEGSLTGDLAALGTAVMLAVTFTLTRANKQVSMVPAIGFAAIMNSIIVLPLAGAIIVPEGDLIWILLLGLLVVPLGTGLLAVGPRYIPAPDVSLLLLLESILGPIFVWLVIAERPNNQTLLGGAIIILALAISNIFALLKSRHRLARNHNRQTNQN